MLITLLYLERHAQVGCFARNQDDALRGDYLSLHGQGGTVSADGHSSLACNTVEDYNYRIYQGRSERERILQKKTYISHYDEKNAKKNKCNHPHTQDADQNCATQRTEAAKR